MDKPSNSAAILLNGEPMLSALLADIQVARSSIHISMFLWFRDQIGKEVAEAVIGRRAKVCKSASYSTFRRRRWATPSPRARRK